MTSSIVVQTNIQALTVEAAPTRKHEHINHAVVPIAH